MLTNLLASLLVATFGPMPSGLLQSITNGMFTLIAVGFLFMVVFFLSSAVSGLFGRSR